jgi:dienelactone hydrolase
MRRSLITLTVLAALALPVQAQEPADSRLGKPKDYNGCFSWTPPSSKEAWARRRQEVREQVLVATGLWPMPARPPIKAVIHGKIERDGYTVEKVFFASYPGHYVTGNLYRPTAKSADAKRPGVLCPHGHWAKGRFYENNEEAAKKEIKDGAEKTMEGARYPLQARCAQLARMGCVVFHYDMVGYADSKQIDHRAGFTDPQAELRLQSFMGLQTFNSVRALDFLLSLPEVDAKRIGVTGASGGGTQTFILCAIDDRPAAAFPAVMVSTAMQGGCICENCSYLRIGTGNIELAAIFAPKPLAMSGANDWTIDIETKGLPQLKILYDLLGARDKVAARCFAQFGHNYNQVSREVMYNWFNKHLGLGQKEPVVERPFVPIPPKELSVFDAEHRLPKDAVDVRGLREHMTRESEKQLGRLYPSDAETLAEFRAVLQPALRAMITDKLPERKIAVLRKNIPDGRMSFVEMNVGRPETGEQVPAVLVTKGAAPGRLVVWVHPAGLGSLRDQGQLASAGRRILDSGAAILAVEVYRTGASKSAAAMPINEGYAGYTFGYNRPALANRVHDVLSAVAAARALSKSGKVDLIGFESAGPWVVLARGLCGDAVDRTAADLNQFRFESVKSMDAEMMLPGALKYGGMTVLAALAAPHELYLHNTRDGGSDAWPKAAYGAAGRAENLHWHEGKSSADQIVSWLVGSR